MSEERVKQIVDDVLTNNASPIFGLRLLLPFRDMFGDIRNPITNAITGLESQTDHLIISEDGKVVDASGMSEDDLTYFNKEALSLFKEIDGIINRNIN